MAQAVLECEGLRKSFGDRMAVCGVGFHVDPGETYGLLGPNGAGKTTTISMIAGVLRPDAGTVLVAGTPLDDHHPRARGAIGLVPQEIALYPDLSARENLQFFGRLQGLGQADLAHRVNEVLEVVGLTDRAGDRVDTYSGGMKRRANIAAGLLHRPPLLILDEPTVGVDPQSRNAILDAIEALGSEGMAVLYTTHYMEEAERLCHRIGIIDDGVLVAEGTRRELVERIGEHDVVAVTAVGALDAFAAGARALPGVLTAQATDGQVLVTVTRAAAVLAPLVEAADAAGVTITAIEVQEPDLEAVFLHLTGKALRD